MSETQKRILILAGEASGDLLGAHLVKSLKEQTSHIEFFGMGGALMQRAGVEIHINADQLAVVGGWEVLTHLKDLRIAFKKMKLLLSEKKPDLVILIDYPGFNLRVAKMAKKAGRKVLFYVSPQIWAWRYHRVKHIRQYVDHMAVLFAFEEKIYQKENIPVSFVGHPLADIAKPDLDKETVYRQYKLNANEPIIALLPGSRTAEIKRMLPIMMNAVTKIKSKIANAQFILPLAPSLDKPFVNNFITPDIKIIENNIHNVLQVCEAAITVSGTTTLEVALARVPMVIIYKMNALTFSIAYRIINLKLEYIGLCNIIAQTGVAIELIQHEVTPDNIANEIIKIIQDNEYREAKLRKLNLVHQNIGEQGGSQKAAAVALSMI